MVTCNTCKVCKVSFPNAENVTCGVRDTAPRDVRRKRKYVFLLRKMAKIMVTHSDLNK